MLKRILKKLGTTETPIPPLRFAAGFQMTTIITIRNEFKKAKSLRAAGDILNAARLAVAVQNMASGSRSKHAYKIECDAHLMAVMALDKAAGADHAARSELGRIRAESKYAFQRGGTASRSVVPVL